MIVDEVKPGFRVEYIENDTPKEELKDTLDK